MTSCSRFCFVLSPIISNTAGTCCAVPPQKLNCFILPLKLNCFQLPTYTIHTVPVVPVIDTLASAARTFFSSSFLLFFPLFFLVFHCFSLFFFFLFTPPRSKLRLVRSFVRSHHKLRLPGPTRQLLSPPPTRHELTLHFRHRNSH